MKIIEEQVDLQKYTSNIYNNYMEGLNFGVLDIETVGLSPEKNAIILVGLLREENEKFFLTQFFAESIEEEPLLLLKTLEYMSRLDGLITFNGDRFDIPFIKKRCEIHNIDYNHFPEYSLDIYKFVRYYSDLKSILPNLRQKTLENYMGFWEHRKDEISGGDSVLLYYDYLVTRDSDAEAKILLHNRDDVVNLYRLLHVLKHVDFHKAMFSMGLPVKTKFGLHQIKSIKIKNDSIQITGFQCNDISLNRNSICYADIENPIAYEFITGEYVPSLLDGFSNNETTDNFSCGTFSIYAKDIKFDDKILANLNHKELNTLAKDLLLFILES